MADSTKYMPINGGTLISDLKLSKIFSFRTKTTKAFASVFISVFVGFTVFLAFNPSSNPSSPWFSSIFNTNTLSIHGNITTTGSSSSSSSSGGNGCVGSQFSCIYSYFFPSNSSNQQTSASNYSHPANSTSVSTHPQNSTSSPLSSSTTNSTNSRSQGINTRNQTLDKKVSDKDEILKQNQTATGSQSSSNVSNPSQSPKSAENGMSKVPSPSPETQKSAVPVASKNGSANGADKKIEEKSMAKNLSSSLVKNQRTNATNSGVSAEQGINDLVKNLVNCNLFDGNWVRDESYPLYKPGSCSLIDEQFNCFMNGRPDKGFQMLKWKPKGCTLPRLDGGKMLQLLRGKRLVFVGDSLNRNMWESLVCILRNSVKDQTKVYEASGRQHFRSEASYSFVFEDYNCTVEFFVTPFLVQEWETKDKNGTKKETLRLDLVSNSAPQYKDADVIVFNTGHWWTHDKTAKGEDYYQEGSHVYKELNVLEAFRKAMTTWGIWVDANINPNKTMVFFRGYSASHFSGGQWNSGGACDSETEPIKNTTYLTPYPDKMIVMEKVLRNMKVHVSYLNITRLTDFRKDGHPSIYRKQHYTEEERRSPLHFQDCSHWCLPGVPDSWNEILYAELLAKQYQNQRRKG